MADVYYVKINLSVNQCDWDVPDIRVGSLFSRTDKSHAIRTKQLSTVADPSWLAFLNS